MTTDDTSRRTFLSRSIGIIAGLFGLLLGIPILGYTGSVLTKRESEQWVAVCPLDQIGSDDPKEFRVSFSASNAPQPYEDVRGVFVIRKGGDILAFTNVCAHMGCSVRWVGWRDQILCPCHGGTYDRWGNLVGGPPASSLPFYETKIENETLYVANRMISRGSIGND